MFIDLSLPLTESLPKFPGYPGFESQQFQSLDQDGKVSYKFSLTTHTGTHIDAPAHFIPDGSTIDEIMIGQIVGEYRVIDLREYSGERITQVALSDALTELKAGARVLLVTGDVDNYFHSKDFFEQAAVLTPDAAEWLVDQGVKSVANDFLTESVDVPSRPVHHIFLEANIPLIEYLCNTDAVVDQQAIQLWCLPLSVSGLEAAPARVVAVDRGNTPRV